MKQLFATTCLLIVFSFTGYSQITVDANNNVGIAEDEPVSKFAVNDPGINTATVYIENCKNITSSRSLHVENNRIYSSDSWRFSIVASTPVNSSGSSKTVGLKSYAISPSSLSSKRSYGVWGMAGNATNGYNYGVYGELYGSNNGAAIFAIVPGRSDVNVSGKYAGYFNGDVHVQDDIVVIGNVVNPSDINLKKEVRPLAEEGISQMDKLNTLTSIKYKIKNPGELYMETPELSDTLKIDPRSLKYDEPVYTRDNIGLSAQEVQLVFPELVTENNDGYLNLNYIGLIPVLVEALKEQNAEIELLRKEIEQLKYVK